MRRNEREEGSWVIRGGETGTKISWRRGALSRRCRHRRHKSAEGKTFWARSYQSVSARVNARMCTYILHTYVYAVLSDGTRGCCGLIYRLSLPWKPRRDRLARHPHIRVDSGLLYSPPRLVHSLARSCSHPLLLPLTLYTHRSVSHSPLSSSVLISSPPPRLLVHSIFLFLSFSSSLPLSLPLPSSPYLPLSLFLHSTLDLFPSLSHPTLILLSFSFYSLYVLLLPKRVSLLVSSIPSSFILL